MSMFRKPSTKVNGTKILVMGETGAGKSLFGLSFPKVYALDSETGLSFYEGQAENLLGVANTQDFNELSEAIDEITDMVDDDPEAVKTLMIDSETKFYQNLTDASLQVEEKKARDKGKDVNDSSISQRGWGRIKNIGTRLQNMKIDLSAKGVNVISIAQIEDVKEKKGDNFVKVGERAVMQKNAAYDYDIVIKLFVEQDAKGEFHYKGIILKDRTKVTKVGQVFENPSYEIWKDYLENRTGDKIESNLSKDHEKAKKALEEEDKELEKTTVDKFREAMANANEEQKKKAVEMIGKAKIKNPLEPKDEKELKALAEIVKVITK